MTFYKQRKYLMQALQGIGSTARPQYMCENNLQTLLYYRNKRNEELLMTKVYATRFH